MVNSQATAPTSHDRIAKPRKLSDRNPTTASFLASIGEMAAPMNLCRQIPAATAPTAGACRYPRKTATSAALLSRARAPLDGDGGRFVGAGLGVARTALRGRLRRRQEARIDVGVGGSERMRHRRSPDAHLCTAPTSGASRRSSASLASRPQARPRPVGGLSQLSAGEPRAGIVRALHCHLHAGDLHLIVKSTSNTAKEDMGDESTDEYLDIVRMMFASEDDGFEFYNSYALEKGLSVRKSYVEWDEANQEIILSKLVCNHKDLAGSESVDMSEATWDR
ncbi:hypothetical protein ACQ4PT_018392 [Festuca glaucescens]